MELVKIIDDTIKSIEKAKKEHSRKQNKYKELDDFLESISKEKLQDEDFQKAKEKLEKIIQKPLR